MDRIIFKDFLSQSSTERLDLIRNVQALRTNALEESRTKKGRQTKSARRNAKKRGIKSKDDSATLLKLLKSLPPDKVAAIKEAYDL